MIRRNRRILNVTERRKLFSLIAPCQKNSNHIIAQNLSQAREHPAQPSIPNRLTPELVCRDHFLPPLLRDHLPKHQNEAIYDHQPGLFWARYMAEVTNKSKALNESLAAVSLAVVTRANSDERLISAVLRSTLMHCRRCEKRWLLESLGPLRILSSTDGARHI